MNLFLGVTFGHAAFTAVFEFFQESLKVFSSLGGYLDGIFKSDAHGLIVAHISLQLQLGDEKVESCDF